VKELLPGGTDRHAKVILDLPGITVSVPSPLYLLALKLQAARIDRDQDDIRFLARETGAKTADDVLRIAEQVIGSNRLLPKAQFIVGAAAGGRKGRAVGEHDGTKRTDLTSSHSRL
jgi:hypothetical protein